MTGQLHGHQAQTDAVMSAVSGRRGARGGRGGLGRLAGLVMAVRLRERARQLLET